MKLDVNITKWEGPNVVEFTLKGLNEDVDGDGTVTMEPVGEPDQGQESLAVVEAPAEVKKGLWHRFVAWLMRAVTGGKSKDEAAPVVAEPARPGATNLEFRLRMDAGGPMAPMINAMLGPACAEAAEALGGSIAAKLREIHGVQEPDASSGLEG